MCSRLFETRSLPSSLATTHRGFAFYVALPSIPSRATCSISLIPAAPLKLVRCPRSLAPTPRRFTFYVADPISSIETRSLPTLTRSYPRRFTFYVADPISSIRSELVLRRYDVVVTDDVVDFHSSRSVLKSLLGRKDALIFINTC